MKKACKNFSPLYPIDFFEMLTRRTVQFTVRRFLYKLQKRRNLKLKIENFYAVFLYFNGFAVLAKSRFTDFLVCPADAVNSEKNTKQYHR